MAQSLNLLDASFQRRRRGCGSGAALLAVGVAIAAAAAGGLVLQAQAGSVAARAAALGQELAALQARAAEAGPAPQARAATELARLRELEAGQRLVLAALESGPAGVRIDYSKFLLALSRQSRPALWLTAFSIGSDGRSLEIAGRMTDARELPLYLRRLEAEPLFKGREFAQLSLSTPAAQSQAAVLDFTLRSKAAAESAR